MRAINLRFDAANFGESYVIVILKVLQGAGVLLVSDKHVEKNRNFFFNF